MPPTPRLRFCEPVHLFIGEGNGNPLQYSYLGNLMDIGAWWASELQSMGSQESDTTESLNHHISLWFKSVIV